MNDADTMAVLGLVLIVLPIAVIWFVNRVFRKQAGFGKGWGGVLIVCLCWIAAMWVMRTKLEQFL